MPTKEKNIILGFLSKELNRKMKKLKVLTEETQEGEGVAVQLLKFL